MILVECIFQLLGNVVGDSDGANEFFLRIGLVISKVASVAIYAGKHQYILDSVLWESES